MNTPQSKKIPVNSSQPMQPPYTYAGLNDSGRIQLTRDGKTLLINGAVYARTIPTAGHTKIVLIPVNSTPGYKREPEHKTYPARTVTGETYRVIGIVEKTLRPAAPNEKKNEPALSESTTKTPDAEPVPKAKHSALDSTLALPKSTNTTPINAKKQAKLVRIEKEFQRVKAQLDSGLDPAVRMAFAAHYLGESESNLYRKKAEGQFPQSIQRGKGTFWLVSDLDAFKKGAWKPTT